MNEQEVKQQLAQFCKTYMTNRDAVVSSLLNDTVKLSKFSKGLEEMAKTIESGSDANVRKQLFNTMVVMKHLCDSQVRTIYSLVPYLVAGDAQTDAAKAAMIFGVDGKDVLQEMMSQKLKS